jgi:DNA-binding transcriptional LysR family regulator
MPNFTLSQIKTFLMVTELGSFQAVAAKLRTTQPAISQRIKELERILGVELFDRTARYPRLTPVGRALVPHAARLVGVAEEIAREIAGSDAVSGLVKIGATDAVALSWLPQLVQQLNREFPKLEVELIIGLSVTLFEALKNHEIDIALIAGPLAWPNLVSVPIGRLQNAWMAAPRLTQATGMMTPEAMAKLPIFTYASGSHQSAMIHDWFKQHGVEPSRINVCSSMSAILQMAVSGLGLAVLPPEMMEQDLAAGKLAVIATAAPLPSIDFEAAYLANTHLTFLEKVTMMAADIATHDATFGRKSPQPPAAVDAAGQR